MPYPRYTKADLERIVYTQLENLDAVHDLLQIMKEQNALIAYTNKKLKDEISGLKKKIKPYPTNNKKRKSF